MGLAELWHSLADNGWSIEEIRLVLSYIHAIYA